MKALIDDPVWVLDRYREAKEILGEMQALAALPDDLREVVEEWLTLTTMDACTTCGTDCACNRARLLAEASRLREWKGRGGSKPSAWLRENYPDDAARFDAIDAGLGATLEHLARFYEALAADD